MHRLVRASVTCKNMNEYKENIPTRQRQQAASFLTVKHCHIVATVAASAQLWKWACNEQFPCLPMATVTFCGDDSCIPFVIQKKLLMLLRSKKSVRYFSFIYMLFHILYIYIKTFPLLLMTQKWGCHSSYSAPFYNGGHGPKKLWGEKEGGFVDSM